MLKNGNKIQENFINRNNIIFSFGKSDTINDNSNNNNVNLINNENKNNNKRINDRQTQNNKILNCISIYKMLNKSKIQAKESAQPLLNIDNINLANIIVYTMIIYFFCLSIFIIFKIFRFILNIKVARQSQS